MHNILNDDSCKRAYENVQRWSPDVLTRIWEYLDKGVCPEMVGQEIAKRGNYKTRDYLPYIQAAKYMQAHPELRG